LPQNRNTETTQRIILTNMIASPVAVQVYRPNIHIGQYGC
jgi:hypothetical protein